MTEKEAIHCMKSYLPEATDEDCRNCPFYGSMKTYDPQIFLCKSSEAHKMAIDALEKQIPKKPEQSKIPRYVMRYEYYDWYCPTCGRFLAFERSKGDHHCTCGQAIDWEET